MRKAAVIPLGLAMVAMLLVRARRRPRAWFRELKGWQKLLGVIAVIAAVLILLNPEFAALSLMGDTAFFDLVVLALSVQMLGYAQWTWRLLRSGFIRSIRWLGIPSPGLRYFLCKSAVALSGAISVIRKIAHLLSS